LAIFSESNLYKIAFQDLFNQRAVEKFDNHRKPAKKNHEWRSYFSFKCFLFAINFFELLLKTEIFNFYRSFIPFQIPNQIIIFIPLLHKLLRSFSFYKTFNKKKILQ